MKLSKRSAYALHALMYMVRHLTQLPASAVTIARAEQIPERQLPPLLKRLSLAGLVRIVPGRRKQYLLAKAPERISLLEVFESVEGQPLFGDCLLKHWPCGGTPANCSICKDWCEATGRLSKAWAETSLAAVSWSHPAHTCGDRSAATAQPPDGNAQSTEQRIFDLPPKGTQRNRADSSANEENITGF